MPQSAKPPIRMRLTDTIAIVVGAGQSPGEGLGNGRATVLRFVQEGTKVLTVDHNPLLSRGESRHGETVGRECVASMRFRERSPIRGANGLAFLD
jgi:NAD(P)-dependent dehydrogenase (short-subunit alcohol dehydrogenase family)